ncbi:1-(5-phosphoribosyl)-5-[(5-phosphoribosylamino)methylideneamino] imidazole-4-carboxamide isomerase [Luteibacter sp. SG786]|jgi:phosphoribosylformimino-5-aminoimidazole carboxamide ribotide isomerase|uniref:1-(5-phosphoribosyl)-5-[(5- phosphoribosylamino)methylideneamino]imidazole-4- carboxamide isomerase n=1 Tax=Luteibacter sp. SG786 TaxID=2587130 RepID=UPI001421EA13|nr:1-(5-phosphoribosyl)-5-[(5-phosphoribosylamino)methylideneamino] imidazole-4-carboxamide isomerase [Luteibacter sp. SG786]NII53301.1 phosphoribosylformimino-5-aminoimidazole carboxamide ribotide isomerase [Luteibacter sp. SG786]
MTLPIPAIDLRDGKVVRLYKGDYARQTTFAFEPEALAARYADEGAEWLHVVDLDGARSGRFENLATVAGIASSGRLRVQAGGGVRNEDGVLRLLEAGVHRVVVGSVAMRDPKTVASWIARYGAERIVLALDTRFLDGEWRLPSAGWTAYEVRTLDELLPLYEAAGARHLLCTDIDRDGTMSGPNVALYRHLGSLAPSMAVQASGGVRSLDDIAALALQGTAGVILGRALLEGAFSLSDAFAAAEKANASC